MEGIYINILCSFIIFVFYIGDVTRALHITNIKVPSTLATGEKGWLDCEWDDEEKGQIISTLTWYFGHRKFYKWIPTKTPSVTTFSVPGNPFKVDFEASERGRVRISQATLEATGFYECKVTGEIPSLHADSQYASMTIVDLPDSKPIFTGIQPSYQMHDNVQLNCSSPNSQPPATLIFLVNDKQADPSWIARYKSEENPATGLKTSVLGLRLSLSPRVIRQGKVSIECIAVILDTYRENTEISIFMDERSSSADVLSSATTCLLCLVFGGVFSVIP